jgi:hypothetical protein
VNRYDDNADVKRVEFDFSRATRAKGPRFPEGFEIRINDATGYSLRLTPSNKILGRFTSTRDAWPVVIAEIERGIPARCLVLEAHFADGDREKIGAGRILEHIARAGIGQTAARRPVRAAS